MTCRTSTVFHSKLITVLCVTCLSLWVGDVSNEQTDVIDFSMDSACDLSSADHCWSPPDLLKPNDMEDYW